MSEEQEKAKELIIKMQFSKPPLMFDKAKQCALICVDEIIKVSEYLGEMKAISSDNEVQVAEFWTRVRKEIEAS